MPPAADSPGGKLKPSPAAFIQSGLFLKVLIPFITPGL